LIAGPQADAAVGVFGQTKLDVQFEVPELPFGDQVARSAGARQEAVLDGPAEWLVGGEGSPSGARFLVKKRDRFAFAPGAIVLVADDRRAHAGPVEGRTGGAIGSERADQPAAFDVGRIDVVELAAALLITKSESEFIALNRDLINGVECAPVVA